MKLFVLIILFPILSLARPIKIGIIDTGFDTSDKTVKRCDSGMFDMDLTNSGLQDHYGHGNNILHIIIDDLLLVDYCVVNVKVIDVGPYVNPFQYELGLVYLNMLNLDIINISLNGGAKDRIETVVLKSLLDKGTIVVAAAGNEKKDLDKECSSYPACTDKRVISVGCLKPDGKTKCEFSNYGSYVKNWQIGINVTAGGSTLSGTSQATARTTNRLVKMMSKVRK